MMKLLYSIKTGLWIMGIAMALFVTGSFIIPQNLDVFSEINDVPLFAWLARNRGEIGATFWIYLLAAVMTVLAANVLACGYDSLRRGLSGRRAVELLSPQIVHLGVLLVLFGHLTSAATGYKEDVPMKLHERTVVRGHAIELASLDFVQVPGEDSTRWRVGLRVDGGDAVLQPAQPLFRGGIGYFAKSASQRNNTALVGLVHDPGADWQIAGALVFLLGAAGLSWGEVRG